jgi:hypothetical protein
MRKSIVVVVVLLIVVWLGVSARRSSDDIHSAMRGDRARFPNTQEVQQGCVNDIGACSIAGAGISSKKSWLALAWYPFPMDVTQERRIEMDVSVAVNDLVPLGNSLHRVRCMKNAPPRPRGGPPSGDGSYCLIDAKPTLIESMKFRTGSIVIPVGGRLRGETSIVVARISESIEGPVADVEYHEQLHWVGDTRLRSGDPLRIGPKEHLVLSVILSKQEDDGVMGYLVIEAEPME